MKSDDQWTGWCGYTDLTLQCLTKDAGKKPVDKPDGEKPKAPPAEAGACESLGKEVKSMSAKIDKIARNMGGPGPRPTPPVATRRRGGGSKRRRGKKA